MTTTEWPKVTGDVGEYIDGTLGGVTDLTSVASLRAHVWVANNPVAVTLTATVLDAVARTVRIDLGASGGWLASTAVAGRYYVEIETTDNAGNIRTFPEREQAIPTIVTRTGR